MNDTRKDSLKLIPGNYIPLFLHSIFSQMENDFENLSETFKHCDTILISRSNGGTGIELPHQIYDKNRIKHQITPYVQYHPNGLKKLEIDPDNKLFQKFHNNGFLQVKATLDFKFNGRFETYHRNGLREVITDVIDNKICGFFILLHNNAYVNTTCYFNQNVPYGNYRKFYRNGNTEIEAFFDSEGRLQNNFKYFYPDGTLVFHGKFINGFCAEIIVNTVPTWAKITTNELCDDLLHNVGDVLNKFDL